MTRKQNAFYFNKTFNEQAIALLYLPGLTQTYTKARKRMHTQIHTNHYIYSICLYLHVLPLFI